MATRQPRNGKSANGSVDWTRGTVRRDGRHGRRDWTSGCGCLVSLGVGQAGFEGLAQGAERWSLPLRANAQQCAAREGVPDDGHLQLE